MIKRINLKSEFLRNSLTLIIGTGLSQVIPVVLQFPLRRMFSPSDFGLYAVYSSVVSILAILANFMYANAVLIPKKDEDGVNLMFGSILLTFVFSVIILLTFLLFSSELINFFDFPNEIEKWFFLIPLSVFFVSSHLTFSYWLTRVKKFKSIATNKVSRRSTEGLSQVLFGSFGFKGGLIIGTIIGDFFNFITYIVQLKKTVKPLLSKVSVFHIKSQLIRYVDFPKYSLLPSFLNNFSFMLPVFIITDLFSKEITGQYDLTVKILSVPLALISITLSQVLVQKVVEQRNNDKYIFPLIKKTFFGLLVISTIGAFIVYFFGEQLFVFSFGDEWRLAGELSTYLVFIYGVRFVVSPLTSVFIALEKIKISSLWQISYFTLILSLYLLEGKSLFTFIIYYTVIDVVAYILYCILIYIISKKHDYSLLHE